MKNIHILPTDKTSRLHFTEFFWKLVFTPKYEKLDGVNIYITSSNADINENDYIITKDVKLVQASYLLSKDLEGASKVILTTDQDLIKDGVQSIDDEFLQWFVNNPSCEEVAVIKKSRCCGRCNGVDDLCYTDIRCDDHLVYGCEACYGKRVEYLITILKEEPKKKHIVMLVGDKVNEEPKQETLQEVAERYSANELSQLGFINGAKWQEQQTIEEVFEWLTTNNYLTDLKETLIENFTNR